MRVIALSLLLSFCATCHSAEPSPDTYSSQFFDTLIKGDSDKAVDGFLTQNPLMKEKTQQLQILKSQLKTVIQVYGQPTAAELVAKEDLAPSLQRRVYITKHDYHPISWEMYFYKGKTGWLPDQLVFVDQYQVIGARK